MAELLTASIAVMAVGMFSQHSHAADNATVRHPAFWGLIILVAAALYAPYRLLLLAMRELGSGTGIAMFAFAEGVGWYGVSRLRRSAGWPRLRRRLGEAVIGAATLLGILGFFAVLAAGVHLLIRAFGLHPAWNAVLLIPLTLAILAAGNLVVDSRRKAAWRQQVFGPLLDRWKVRLEKVPGSGDSYAFRVATTTRSGTAMDLTVRCNGEARDGWVNLRLAAAMPATRVPEFWLVANIRTRCGASPEPIELEHDPSELARGLAQGPLGAGLRDLASCFATASGIDYCRVRSLGGLDIEVFGAAETSRVVEVVDRFVTFAVSAQGHLPT